MNGTSLRSYVIVGIQIPDPTPGEQAHVSNMRVARLTNAFPYIYVFDCRVSQVAPSMFRHPPYVPTPTVPVKCKSELDRDASGQLPQQDEEKRRVRKNHLGVNLVLCERTTEAPEQNIAKTLNKRRHHLHGEKIRKGVPFRWCTKRQACCQ